MLAGAAGTSGRRARPHVPLLMPPTTQMQVDRGREQQDGASKELGRKITTIQTSARMLEGRLLEGPPAWAATLHKVRPGFGVSLPACTFQWCYPPFSAPSCAHDRCKLRELKRRDLQGLCSQMRQLLVERCPHHDDAVAHLERATQCIVSNPLQPT